VGFEFLFHLLLQLLEGVVRCLVVIMGLPEGGPEALELVGQVEHRARRADKEVVLGKERLLVSAVVDPERPDQVEADPLPD
jgi:hypothetical protein